ncbi:MAG: SYNERG-CTERM sorting domain-containing protein, partial [Synergistes sp.]|nr:SYNERG-CTERM sorting domain-containing protein [Synergistes sp.]
EAHRTQEGDLGQKMRRALPNAFFFGLTGTPINLYERNTFQTFGADEDGYVCTVKLSKECAEGAGSGALTLTVKPKPKEMFNSGRSYYALVLNAKTNYYDVFPAKLNGAGHLEATLKPVGDYAALSTIFVYSGTAFPGEEPPAPDEPGGGAGPKSSSGCNAGLGALTLLALAPFALRRRSGK